MNTTPTVPTHQLNYRLFSSPILHTKVGTMKEISSYLKCIGTRGIHTQKREESLYQEVKTKANEFPEIVTFQEIWPIDDGTIPVENWKGKKVPVEKRKEKRVKGVAGITPPLVMNSCTVFVCPETGIPGTVSFQSPIGTGFKFIHPFAQLENVITALKAYQKHGKPMGALSKEELAGMLLTILKAKGFTKVKAGIGLVLNDNLSKVNKVVLIRAITFFWQKGSSVNYPTISLEDGAAMDFRILQYMQICRDEDTSVQVLHMKEKKTSTVKVKVFQTKEEKDYENTKSGIKIAREIIESLRKEFPEMGGKLYEELHYDFDQIIFSTEAHKKAIEGKIFNLFGLNERTKRLAEIIRTVDSDAIGNDLFSLSQQMEREDSDVTNKEPINLMDLLKKQKKG